jgi:hypothetical protein
MGLTTVGTFSVSQLSLDETDDDEDQMRFQSMERQPRQQQHQFGSGQNPRCFFDLAPSPRHHSLYDKNAYEDHDATKITCIFSMAHGTNVVNKDTTRSNYAHAHEEHEHDEDALAVTSMHPLWIASHEDRREKRVPRGLDRRTEYRAYEYVGVLSIYLYIYIYIYIYIHPRRFALVT